MNVTREAIMAWLEAFASALTTEKHRLTELDSAIGDADHGANMERGFQAVRARLPAMAEQDIAAIFKTVGLTLLSTVGGASGPLYGSLFLQMAAAAAGKADLGPDEFRDALAAGVESVTRRGKAHRGEKTMLDALVPALEALSATLAAGASLEQAIWKGERAAHRGMLSTIPMLATKGRASYLGERSIGHQDPGATSSHLLVLTAARAWAPHGEALSRGS